MIKKSLSVRALSAFFGILLLAPAPAGADDGSYLYRLGGCANCHAAGPGEPPSGGVAIRTAIGTFSSPNITMDAATGIGKWTDAQFIRALRLGISPSGGHYYPAFPFPAFGLMSDSDLLAIKSYLSTLGKVARANKSHDLGFWAAMPFAAAIWNSDDTQGRTDLGALNGRDFMFAKGPFRPIPSVDALWNRGAYLVEGPLHCAQCHTQRDASGHLIAARWMAGSTDVGAPNITPARNQWRAADWDRFLRDGTAPGGRSAVGLMSEVVGTQTSSLTAGDRRAVGRYLMALLPVE